MFEIAIKRGDCFLREAVSLFLKAFAVLGLFLTAWAAAAAAGIVVAVIIIVSASAAIVAIVICVATADVIAGTVWFGFFRTAAAKQEAGYNNSSKNAGLVHDIVPFFQEIVRRSGCFILEKALQCL